MLTVDSILLFRCNRKPYNGYNGFNRSMLRTEVKREGRGQNKKVRSKKAEGRIKKILVSTFCFLPQDNGLSSPDTFSDLDSSAA